MTQDENYWKNRPIEDPKMDWHGEQENWVDGYVKSKDHPHRAKLVEIIKRLNPESLLEIGASTGPNLAAIQEAIPGINTWGIDASPVAVEIGQRNGFDIVETTIQQISKIAIPDCVLSDAVLMYVPPKDIKDVFDKLSEATSIVLLEWDDESMLGVEKDYHFARNYKVILEWYGYSVEVIPLTEDIWPTATWMRNGRIYVGKKNTNQ